MDVVRIEGLSVDCVVGVYPRERDAPQPLTVDLDMRLDLSSAAESERVRHTVDYAFMSAQLVFLLETCRFRMLETAAHCLLRYVLAAPAPGGRRAQVEEARIRLIKPSALRGHATPSVTMERDRRWCVTGLEDKSFGTVDVIHETREAGIYRLNVAPKEVIPLHRHEQMEEAEMVLTRGLLCQGEKVDPGTVHRWPRGARHVYENPTDRWQSILCVDSPPFIPEDERPAEGSPDSVSPDRRWPGLGSAS